MIRMLTSLGSLFCPLKDHSQKVLFVILERSANFSLKDQTDSKYFRLFRLCDLCCNYCTLPLWSRSSHGQKCKWVRMAMFQWNLTYKKQICRIDLVHAVVYRPLFCWVHKALSERTSNLAWALGLKGWTRFDVLVLWGALAVWWGQIDVSRSPKSDWPLRVGAS